MKMPSLKLAKLPISYRLFLQLGIFAISLILLAALGFNSLNLAKNATSDLHDLVNKSTLASQVTNNVQSNFVNVVNHIETGTITWLDGAETVRQSKAELETLWRKLNSSDAASHAGHIDQASQHIASMDRTYQIALSAYDLFLKLSESQSRAALELFAINDLDVMVNPFLDETLDFSAQLTSQAESAFTGFANTFDSSIISNAILISITALLSAFIGFVTYRSILVPATQISRTIADVQQGKSDARTGLESSRDELSTLGATLDTLLDEKNATLVKIESENEQINESIIELLEGTSQLSDRDLRVRLTVREDITGPVADAMNMATQEIAEALAKIRQISELVSASSSVIDEQATRANVETEAEIQMVNQTISKLESVSNHMMQIAKWSQASNQIAKKATEYTDNAYESVTNTVNSMEEIRSTISETEKRIKRLSERSQEISSIIDIINSIAERTHVLALNASMQAAAAGDAGRGFAVVADEVQRLAESSRDSTSQISVLVRNIQSETAAAVDTMNISINEVVSGSKLAKQAGEQMKETQSTTNDLARAVAKISEQSIVQARETDTLKKQSHAIQQATGQTLLELARQTEQARRLAAASSALGTTISVFDLPANLLVTGLADELMAAMPKSDVISLEPASIRIDAENIKDNLKAIG